MKNFILSTDSYKHSHYLQFPIEKGFTSYYVEARVDSKQEIVSMGIQQYAKYLKNVRITRKMVLEAQTIIEAHGIPFNLSGWMYIVERLDGKLPVMIEAVPDGTIVNGGSVQAKITNTDENCLWLPGILETSMLRAIWYPSTVATVSRNVKKIIRDNMIKTCDNLDKLPFMLHDFGARGTTSSEQAAIGGMAHLVNFMGSDTLEAIQNVKDVYGGEVSPSYSLPASEHSTITSWGKDREKDGYENMITQFGGEGKMFAVVSDSYDIWNACQHIWGNELKDKVINNGGTLVVRPDSGIPVEVVLRVLDILSERFGTTLNSKGFKVLPDYIRIIQGDGVNPKSIKQILTRMKASGYSADNIAFGMGAGLLQNVNRDTFKYAMKMSAIKEVGGKWMDVFKDPITDVGKISKRGIQHTFRDIVTRKTFSKSISGVVDYDLLEPVLLDGVLLGKQSFEEVRERAEIK